MSKFVASLAVAGALVSGHASAQPAKPTIVLVHGAFADSSSWNGVTKILQKDGYRVVAAANPLRSVSTDAYLSAIPMVGRSSPRRLTAAITSSRWFM